MTSRDETFRGFTPEQAAAYAAGRGGAYPDPIYKTILDFHSGERKLVLDVGTGPGKAVWDLLNYFDRAIGCDVSEQMIVQARKDAEQKGFGGRTSFAVCGGENCSDAVPQEDLAKVDVVTVAMAAHWMDDLAGFYKSVAKVLKPGGTLAIWTCSSYYVHPSVPNSKAIQAILSDLEDRLLLPYMTPGNVLSRNGYDDLTLPWDIKGEETLFDKGSFARRHWDRDGVPSSPPLADDSPGPFLSGELQSLKQLDDGLESASAVVRFRAANPDTAGTENDVVKLTSNKLKEVMGEDQVAMFGPSYSLLLLRKA